MNFEPGRKNIFVVVVDALRRDHVGTYHRGETGLTPAIDGLAAEGIAFEQAYTVTNATEPAMLALFSGRYPTQTMLGHGRMITEEERRRAWGTPLAPPRIRESGYYTIQTGRGLGRWFEAGFDASEDLLSRWEETSTTRIDEVRDRLESVVAKALYRAAPGIGGRIGSAYRSTPDQASTPVERLLERIDEAPDKPLFALTHLMDVHAGWDPADEHLPDIEAVNTGDRLDDLAEEFGSQTTTGDRFEYFARKYAHLGHPVRTGLLDALYRGCVRTADDRIRLLVEGLEARDLLEESWIFVVSDHGESLTEHGIYHDHHGLYDVSTRIPLIIRPPNGGVGRRTDELVQIHDLAPTFVELTDAQPLGDVEGNSLVPLIDADGDGVWDPRAAVLADEGYCQRRSMLRTRSDKLIYAPDGVDQCRYCDRVHGGSIELYDLEADPQETTNVVLGDPDSFRRLRELDTEIRARFYAPPDGRDVEKNEMEREALDNQLEALGYR